MELGEFRGTIPAFSGKGHPEKIKLLGWFLHKHSKREHFSSKDIRDCYDRLHETPPSSFGGYFNNLINQKCLLKSAAGYRLSASMRDELATAYEPKGHKVHVAALLRDLPARIPNLAERTYLDETLICYESGAFRASVVMAWNLAYNHLCDYVVRCRKAEFNARWLVKFPAHHKNGVRSIDLAEDFMENLKESEVIVVCKDAGIISKDVWRILDEKLGKRNSAAHPSKVSIGQLQTDAFIADLVENVVLKFN